MPKPMTWQKVNKFRTFAYLDKFLTSKGNAYVRDHMLVPAQIVLDFKEWRCLMGIDVLFVRDQTLVTYARYSSRHRIVTRQRYIHFKKVTGLKGNDIARLLGYKDADSMYTSRFRWTRIERMLNQYDQINDLKERRALQAA